MDEYFYSLIHPKKFWDSDGVSANYNKSFESACNIIAQSDSRNPKEMTLLTYLQKLEDLKADSKRMTKMK